MPSGFKIDWSKYDDIIKSELPHTTIELLTQEYMPHISTKAVGVRARKLGVQPRRFLTEEHKQRVAEGVRKYRFSSEQDKFISDNKDQMGQTEIARRLNVSLMAVWRRMKELGIQRDAAVLSRVRSIDSINCLDKRLGAYKQFISGLSKSERAAYRQKISEACARAFREGRIKPQHGIGQEMNTKKGGRFSTRSSYETRYVEMLEVDDGVVSFEYEPFEIKYEYNGATRVYFPDFLVFRGDRTELVEVKASRFVSRERNPAKFESASRYCVEEGLYFVVVTEKELFA